MKFSWIIAPLHFLKKIPPTSCSSYKNDWLFSHLFFPSNSFFLMLFNCAHYKMLSQTITLGFFFWKEIWAYKLCDTPDDNISVFCTYMHWTRLLTMPTHPGTNAHTSRLKSTCICATCSSHFRNAWMQGDFWERSGRRHLRQVFKKSTANWIPDTHWLDITDGKVTQPNIAHIARKVSMKVRAKPIKTCSSFTHSSTWGADRQPVIASGKPGVLLCEFQ